MPNFLQERLESYAAEEQGIEAQAAAIYADLRRYGQGATRRINKTAQDHGRFTARQGERMGKATAKAIDFELELPVAAKVLPW